MASKCPRHKEAKIQTTVKIDGKTYISNYCFSCWFDTALNKERKKHEEKLKEFNKRFHLFASPPDRPNVYELKKWHKDIANLGKGWAKEHLKKLRDDYYRHHTPTNFDVVLGLDGRDFEDYLQSLFEKQGYSVIKTPASGDGGVDLVLSTKINNRTTRTAVQCKRYKKSVGVSAIQEVFTGKHIYKCRHAMVITTSDFTAPALKTAKDLKVELWGRMKLMEEINKTFNTHGGNTLTWNEHLAQHSVEDIFPQ